MELRHLRYFVRVAEAENVSRAALKLHISQPAVSRQIRDLENEIGLPLLKRVGKSVRLTEAGRVFLNEARAILERTDEALKNVRALDEHQHMDLHVGYSSWGIDRLFHIILNAHSCAVPNVHVRLHDRRVEDNVDALLAGKLELAFIFVAPKPGALRGLRFLELSREHIRLAVSPTHPFARRRAVSVEDAARQPFIVLVPQEFPDYHFFIDAVFASPKNKPTIVEEHDSVASLISAVEGGRGVGLAGDGFGYVFGNRVKILPLTPDPKMISIGLAARKGPLSPTAETFWQCAKQARSAVSLTSSNLLR
ncbi:MAG TPA: LysR substrate-binding domain-containing protein [Candidatus Udaeobacter sp.]|nr:LysR substrate-binding domain-containing protein [Candidatus Udaeobacter sp.]